MCPAVIYTSVSDVSPTASEHYVTQVTDLRTSSFALGTLLKFSSSIYNDKTQPGVEKVKDL